MMGYRKACGLPCQYIEKNPIPAIPIAELSKEFAKELRIA